jgi:phage terminase large subunit-like protein
MELQSFPQGKHDDMVASISQALSYEVSGYNHYADW